MRKNKYYKKKSEIEPEQSSGFDYCKKCMYAKPQCICNLKFSKSKQLDNKKIDVQEYKEIHSDEAALQNQCENLLNTLKIEYYRVPDFIWKNKSPRLRNLASKYFKGKPDLLCLIPFDDIYIKAIAFELKTEKGRLTQGQQNWQRRLPLIIIRSFEQFQECLNSFLKSEAT